MTLDEVENYIEEVMENDLKPEIKNRIIYQITDEDSGILAATYHSFRPFLIKFYSTNIQRLQDEDLKGRIKRIISHEVAHTFGANERQAIENQKLNIFIK